jgi:hypothetical protein
MVMLQGMSTAVYFACYYCELPYVAEREELTSQHSGTIDCVNCNQVAFGWFDFYDLKNCRPVQPNRPPRDGIGLS